jgi:hypothetical protein
LIERDSVFDRRDNMVNYQRLGAVQAAGAELSLSLEAHRRESEAREKAEREAVRAARAKRPKPAEQLSLI